MVMEWSSVLTDLAETEYKLTANVLYKIAVKFMLILKTFDDCLFCIIFSSMLQHCLKYSTYILGCHNVKYIKTVW